MHFRTRSYSLGGIIRVLRDPDAWDARLRRLTVNAGYKAAGKERERATVEVHVDPEPGIARSPDASAAGCSTA